MQGSCRGNPGVAKRPLNIWAAMTLCVSQQRWVDWFAAAYGFAMTWQLGGV